MNLQKSNKIFYSIGEVSKLVEVKPNILRYWENFFTDLKSVKKNGRRRYYRYDEIKIISTIKDLIFNQGFSIKGAKTYLDNLNKNVNTIKSKSLYNERIQDIIDVLKA